MFSIKVGDIIRIKESHSLIFGGKKGKIVGINLGSRFPVAVIFEKGGIPYYFSQDEIISCSTPETIEETL